MNFKKEVALFIGGFYGNKTRLVKENVKRIIIAENEDGEYYVKHPESDKVAVQAQEYKRGTLFNQRLVFYPVEWSSEEAEHYFNLNYTE